MKEHEDGDEVVVYIFIMRIGIDVELYHIYVESR